MGSYYWGVKEDCIVVYHNKTKPVSGEFPEVLYFTGPYKTRQLAVNDAFYYSNTRPVLNVWRDKKGVVRREIADYQEIKT